MAPAMESRSQLVLQRLVQKFHRFVGRGFSPGIQTLVLFRALAPEVRFQLFFNISNEVGLCQEFF